MKFAPTARLHSLVLIVALGVGLSAAGIMSLPSSLEAQDGENASPAGRSECDKPRGKGRNPGKGGAKIAKPKIEDAVRATIYADNWLQLYLNGNLVAVDSISFIPHNVVSVDILPGSIRSASMTLP